MRIKPYRFLRYGMQILSLAAFIFLVSNLAYPLDWQAQLLAWFSRLDPWALFSHFRWQHSIPPWGWLPLLTLLSALFFGRVFCGWLCPFGALLMLVDQLSRRAFKNPSLAHIRTKILHRSQPLRYFWLLFLAVIFILGANGVLFFTPFALFSHELVSLFQGSAPWVLSVIILGTIFFSRLWCSVLCPTGNLLSFIGRWRFFRYQVAGNCIQCGQCTANCSIGAAPVAKGMAKEGCLTCGDCQRVCPTSAVRWLPVLSRRKKSYNTVESGNTGVKSNPSRRQFIKIAFTMAAAAALWGQTLRGTKIVLRPPGALPAAEFPSVCNRCGRCIKACPNSALQPMPISEGIENFETPHILPRVANCVLCFTCQDVCPTGAIAQVPLEQVKMGTAEIDRKRCIAWEQKKKCVICGEICPVLAIEADEQLRPLVQANKCVGCGSCEKYCPVDGESAIRTIPHDVRI